MNALLRTVLVVGFSLFATAATAAEPLRGYHAEVPVSAATRLDWIFALANQSPAEPPKEWQEPLKDYDSKKQKYELFVPPNYTPKKAAPLVVFISPDNRSTGWKNWQQACQKSGILFAGPHEAGNNCPMQRRVRIVLDVVDDVRRTYNTDPNRTYLAGFSGGGRVAALIAFALPEHFGGVIPVCAGGDLRQEPWLRQRVTDRLSVAMLTGETDFNRGEVERFRGPLLSEIGVRTKVWVFPNMGHGVPSGKDLVEVHQWLDEGAAARQKLALRFPASRQPGNTAATREQASQALLKEGKERLQTRETLFSGLMQLAGVQVRWAGLPAADEARRILEEYEARADRPWEQDDIAQQRRFLIAEARALDAYASGPLPPQYANLRVEMAQGALALWQRVIADGQNAQAVGEAEKRIPELEKLISGK